MPLFEYACGECRHRFEELVFGGRQPSCPRCGSTRLEKLLSVFATAGARQTTPAPGVGSCTTCGDPRGPGACAFD